MIEELKQMMEASRKKREEIETTYKRNAKLIKDFEARPWWYRITHKDALRQEIVNSYTRFR